jgi:hypothetical protein
MATNIDSTTNSMQTPPSTGVGAGPSGLGGATPTNLFGRAQADEGLEEDETTSVPQAVDSKDTIQRDMLIAMGLPPDGADALLYWINGLKEFGLQPDHDKAEFHQDGNSLAEFIKHKVIPYAINQSQLLEPSEVTKKPVKLMQPSSFFAAATPIKVDSVDGVKIEAPVGTNGEINSTGFMATVKAGQEVKTIMHLGVVVGYGSTNFGSDREANKALVQEALDAGFAKHILHQHNEQRTTGFVVANVWTNTMAKVVYDLCDRRGDRYRSNSHTLNSISRVDNFLRYKEALADQQKSAKLLDQPILLFLNWMWCYDNYKSSYRLTSINNSGSLLHCSHIECFGTLRTLIAGKAAGKIHISKKRSLVKNTQTNKWVYVNVDGLD